VGSVGRPASHVRTAVVVTASSGLAGSMREILRLPGQLAALWRTAVAAWMPGHGISDPGFLQPARPMFTIGGWVVASILRPDREEDLDELSTAPGALSMSPGVSGVTTPDEGHLSVPWLMRRARVPSFASVSCTRLTEPLPLPTCS
jgi:hypothetical protein